MMIETSQSLLLKKISLESKWNQLYLDNGCETPDMKWIDLELKKTRLAMRDLANVVARQELLREYSYISS
jgi:hypothetical protein